jgi:hypothetical protein
LLLLRQGGLIIIVAMALMCFGLVLRHDSWLGPKNTRAAFDLQPQFVSAAFVFALKRISFV